jgi:L-serine deaminase
MKSLKQLYRIGNGPSSSHTMGPKKAAQLFLERNPHASRFVVTLYGSLAATGKGHLTDVAIMGVLNPIAPTTIEWQPHIFLPFHPNAMKFEAIDADEKVTDSWTVYSVGGGALSDGEKIVGLDPDQEREIYSMNTITEILDWCEKTGKSYWEYVEECERQGHLGIICSACGT